MTIEHHLIDHNLYVHSVHSVRSDYKRLPLAPPLLYRYVPYCLKPSVHFNLIFPSV